jgi:tight adherence protein C
MMSSLQFFSWIIPVCFAVALSLGLYAVLSAPNGSTMRLGFRGLAHARAIERNEAWRALEPAVRWVGVRLSPLLNTSARTYIDRQILLAGDVLGMLPEELVALTLLSMSLGSVVGAAAASSSQSNKLMFCMLAGLIGGVLPILNLVNLQEDRKKNVHNSLPVVIDLLSLALSAGIDFPGAIRQVVTRASDPNAPIIEELNVILYELSVGKTRKDALTGFAERVPIESVRDFVAAVVQAEERGSPLDEVLRIQAQASRERRSVRAEESAARAGVKMFGPLLIIFCIVMLLILAPLVMGLDNALFRG